MSSSVRNHPLPSQKVWNGIVTIYEAREAAKSKLHNCEEDLKAYRRELDSLGSQSDSSEEFRDAAARKEKAEREREWWKEKHKSLANQQDKAVAEAKSGQDKFLEDIDSQSLLSKPTKQDLYGEDPDATQMKLKPEKPADTRPVGRPGPAKPAAPSPEMGDGVDEHLKTSVNELDLREDIKGKLIKHQFSTVHQLVAQMACQGESEADALMSVVEDSMTMAEAKAVCKAVKTFRAKHRDAMLKKDRGE